MSQDLNDYKDRLFPLMCRDINLLFPEMNFHLNRRGDKLVSNHHFSGDRDSQGKEIVNIDLSKPYSAYDLSKGEAKNLIEWYREKTGLQFFPALDQIADLCNTPKFERTQQSEESRNIQKNRENALDLFIKNLWSDRPEADRVLEYLRKERKWSDEDIKKAELGLITTDLRDSLPDSEFYFMRSPNWEIGKTHLLAIPYRVGSRLSGFIFREIGVETGSKYLNSVGTPKTETFFGLSIGQKKLVVTEGVLDALHAQIKGDYSVVATMGGAVSNKQAQHAIARGVNRFILLFDNDKAGKSFILPSIDTIERAGGEVYIADFPDGIKDLDQYLRDHDLKEWEEIKSQVSHAYNYRYDDIIGRYTNRDLYDQDTQDLLGEIDNLLSTPFLLRNPHYRNRILLRVEDNFKGLGLTIDLLTDYLKQRAEEREKEQKERDRQERERERLKTLTENNNTISDLLSKGKVKEATALMRQIAEEPEEESSTATYDSLLNDDIDEVISSMRNKPKGIITNIELGGSGYRFYIPSGGITIIGAPTGHGKSKMLISLSLDTLSEDEEGIIIYVTYEENKESVIRQMINAYADIDLTAQTKKHGNFQTINEYFSDGITTYMRGDTIEPFKGKVEEFKSLYRQKKIVVIRPEDNLSTSLLGLLKRAVSTFGKIKGIFIDYVQELYLPDAKAKVRADELKQIMVDLDLFAQETSLPIVMGAQLRRETSSPVSMSNQDIADSGWIERKASEILLLWSNQEKVKNDTAKESLTEKINNTIYPGLDLGTSGKILAKLTKSRYTEKGIHAILNINGNTGRIHFNTKKEDNSPNW